MIDPTIGYMEKPISKQDVELNPKRKFDEEVIPKFEEKKLSPQKRTRLANEEFIAKRIERKENLKRWEEKEKLRLRLEQEKKQKKRKPLRVPVQTNNL